ncbi:hypothetical protein K438DRAFT_1774131 [Mycena galopus ATCC 62051]|nr:hypothetical protein K438DRAFT_1774131 [Mycena galopus ATCC 62051]
MSTEVGKAGLVSPPRVEDYAERQLSLAKREMIQFSSCLHGCWPRNFSASALDISYCVKLNCRGLCISTYPSWNPVRHLSPRDVEAVNRLPWGHFLVQARDQLSPKTSPTQEERSRNSAKTTAKTITLMHKQRTEIRRNIGSSATRAALPLLTHLRFHVDLPQTLVRSEPRQSSRAPANVKVEPSLAPRVSAREFKRRRQVRVMLDIHDSEFSALSLERPVQSMRRLWVSSASVRGLSRSPSRSRSRSKSSERTDLELLGRVEEIEFQAEQSRNDLNARLLVLERHVPTLSPITGITAADVQKATVQRFEGVVTDLNVLNDGLYDQSRKQSDINATLRTKMAALEAENESLRANYAEQGRTLAALQVAISRLEITSAAPLVLRTHGILPQRSHSPPRLNHQPFRTRSRSPPQGHASKRLRLDDPNGFIAFGPLTESAETPQKQFELYLRTAIPHFRLEAPYTVRSDSDYTGHLRVTVKSAQVARALIDAWAKQTVAGYSKVRMVEMAAAHGKEGPMNAPGTQLQSASHGNAHGRPQWRSSNVNQQRHSEPGGG